MRSLSACSRCVWLLTCLDSNLAALIHWRAQQIVDGVQGVTQGVLRGIGRQQLLAVLNFTAFWVSERLCGGFVASDTYPPLWAMTGCRRAKRVLAHVPCKPGSVWTVVGVFDWTRTAGCVPGFIDSNGELASRGKQRKLYGVFQIIYRIVCAQSCACAAGGQGISCISQSH